MTLAHADSLSAAEEQQSRRPEQPYFRPDIEGLRAVAVTAVVLFHAAVPGIGGGYVGVDVFFVISGFLITGLLWREVSSTGSVRLRSFYGARARRLLPASAAVGVVTMIAAILLLPPLRVPTVLYDGVASALYVGNYWFIIDNINYFSDLLTPSPFLHYWSLGVEEQFYLVWAPLILGIAWLIRRFRRNRARAIGGSRRPYLIVLGLVAAVSFALSLVITYVVPAAAFFSLPTRAWQLAVGGLVALTATAWQRLSPRAAAVSGWAGLAMIVIACVWFTSATPFPGTAALLPTLGAVLVIGAGCATPSQGCGQFLSTSPMRAVGRISYSWYLWHWPVLVLAPALLGHSLNLAERIIAALLAAGLAWLTLRYLENPLRFAPKIRTSAWRSLGVGAVATAIAVFVGVGLLKAVPTPVGPGAPAAAVALNAVSVPTGSNAAAYDTAVAQTRTQLQAVLAAAVATKAPVPSNLTPPLDNLAAEQEDYTYQGCLRTPYEDGQPECVMGDITSPNTVALIGDSHAAMWTPALQQIATQRHWRLQMMAKEACALMDARAGSAFSNLVEDLQHCQQWRDEIVARLAAEHPRLVVVSVWRGYGTDETMSGFRAYDRAWLDGMTQLVRQLRETGAQVLMLGPIPSPHANVPICVSGHLDDAAACSLSRPSAVDQSGIAAEAAATAAGGGQYADLSDLFCATERCPVIVGNTLVYLDVSHLTLQYSRVLTPAIAALVDRAFAQR
ncbi:acyltransferase family protein [Mycobacterium sp. EPa45]|uniref:acyltransferase family protein n=1 Tax=Mycobacterium sp. EPa45 TaxID=1545728 RepID=UPI0006426AC8|nr:acyltransferase family protein [Mycobacterium sp. EPa45]AKK28968.1 acyltransferase [Mycobacterium sp. EPa45]